MPVVFMCKYGSYAHSITRMRARQVRYDIPRYDDFAHIVLILRIGSIHEHELIRIRLNICNRLHNLLFFLVGQYMIFTASPASSHGPGGIVLHKLRRSALLLHELSKALLQLVVLRAVHPRSEARRRFLRLRQHFILNAQTVRMRPGQLPDGEISPAQPLVMPCVDVAFVLAPVGHLPLVVRVRQLPVHRLAEGILLRGVDPGLPVGVVDRRPGQPRGVVVHLHLKGRVRIQAAPVHRAGRLRIDIGLQCTRNLIRALLLSDALSDDLLDAALQAAGGRPDSLGQNSPVRVHPSADQRLQRVGPAVGQHVRKAVGKPQLGHSRGAFQIFRRSVRADPRGAIQARDDGCFDLPVHAVDLPPHGSGIVLLPAPGQTLVLRALRLLLQSRRRSNVDLPDQSVCGGDLAQQSGALPSAQLLGVLHAVPPLFQPGCPALLQQLPFLSNLLQLSVRVVQIMPLLNVAPPAARLSAHLVQVAIALLFLVVHQRVQMVDVHQIVDLRQSRSICAGHPEQMLHHPSDGVVPAVRPLLVASADQVPVHRAHGLSAHTDSLKRVLRDLGHAQQAVHVLPQQLQIVLQPAVVIERALQHAGRGPPAGQARLCLQINRRIGRDLQRVHAVLTGVDKHLLREHVVLQRVRVVRLCPVVGVLAVHQLPHVALAAQITGQAAVDDDVNRHEIQPRVRVVAVLPQELSVAVVQALVHQASAVLQPVFLPPDALLFPVCRVFRRHLVKEDALRHPVDGVVLYFEHEFQTGRELQRHRLPGCAGQLQRNALSDQRVAHAVQQPLSPEGSAQRPIQPVLQLLRGGLVAFLLRHDPNFRRPPHHEPALVVNQLFNQIGDDPGRRIGPVRNQVPALAAAVVHLVQPDDFAHLGHDARSVQPGQLRSNPLLNLGVHVLSSSSHRLAPRPLAKRFLRRCPLWMISASPVVASGASSWAFLPMRLNASISRAYSGQRVCQSEG
nr:MAG TPA: hypothetical protein [Caudoviricetes sp.]